MYISHHNYFLKAPSTLLIPKAFEGVDAEVKLNVKSDGNIMTEEMVAEEQEILSAEGQDPLVALKQQEINIKAEDLERKAAMDAGRLGIDQQKIQQNAKLTREKIDSQEDIAQLRANVNLKKAKDPKKIDEQRNIRFEN